MTPSNDLVKCLFFRTVYMSVPGLCASDEEESSDEEMNDEYLPYQRDWKNLSDDEDNELEE